VLVVVVVVVVVVVLVDCGQVVRWQAAW